MKKKYISIISIIIIFYLFSCSGPNISTNPEDKLVFSNDTIQFDTIFTQVGSCTRYFVVKNSNKNKSICIDDIFLGKLSSSKYRLNIDGYSANRIKNHILQPGDSVFVFVEVTINPNRDNMLEEDSIVFISNGNVQAVKLVAFGQDVHLLNGQYIRNDTIWTATKPILIYNSALIDTFTTVTVLAGTKVYLHRAASLFVKGSLKILGDIDNRVVFAGDRLEKYYSETPGQWGAFLKDKFGNTTYIFGGIHLLPGSRNNEFNNLDIKNSIIGLEVDSCVTVGLPTVKLKNVNIENSKVVGLYSKGGHIEAENCVFANSGQYNLACVIGGKYSFIHCTMANYWKEGTRQTPQLLLNNYYYSGSALIQRPLIEAYFGNCIIYGSLDNELAFDLADNVLANFKFDNCLIKYKKYADLSNENFFVDNIYNVNPNFRSISSQYNYELDTLSAAKDKAKITISNLVILDAKGTNRLLDSKPDIGAFERIE